jgi:hypothetical protein
MSYYHGETGLSLGRLISEIAFLCPLREDVEVRRPALV